MARNKTAILNTPTRIGTRGYSKHHMFSEPVARAYRKEWREVVDRIGASNLARIIISDGVNWVVFYDHGQTHNFGCDGDINGAIDLRALQDKADA